MIKYKPNVFSNHKQKNFISDWLSILFGISPVYPRRRKNGNNFTYFSYNGIKKLGSSPLNEKIRQILLWKKSIQRNIGSNSVRFGKTLNFETPTYSIDELILGKFPNFSEAITDFFKFIPVLFLIFYKTSLFYRSNKISKFLLLFVIKFQHFFLKSVKLRNIFAIKTLLNVELEFRKKKFNLLLPGKYKNIKIFGKKKTLKILIDFQIQLSQNIIVKMFSFQKARILSGYSYEIKRLLENWFENPYRYYKIQKALVFANFKPKFNHVVFSLMSLSKRLHDNRMFYHLWNFSKNSFSIISRKNFRGVFFYTRKNFSNFSSDFILSLLKPLFCKKKNDFNVIFYFSVKFSKKYSMLSSFIFFNFIIDSVNLGITIPTLPYLNEVKNNYMNFKKKKGKKKNSPIRFSKNFQDFYYDSAESSLENSIFSMFKNKKNKTGQSVLLISQKDFIDICFINN